MSHFECRLNQRFWRSIKVVQVVQIGGRGRGNLDKIQKNSYFFLETVPYKTNQIFAHWRLGGEPVKKDHGAHFSFCKWLFFGNIFLNFLHFCFIFGTVSLCVGTGESASEKALCWVDYLFFFSLGRISFFFRAT